MDSGALLPSALPAWPHVSQVGADRDIEVLLMSIPTDDEAQRPVPEGMTGEIWMHSPSVAAGYWGRPDATEATVRG